jgi:hypothetical protein
MIAVRFLKVSNPHFLIVDLRFHTGQYAHVMPDTASGIYTDRKAPDEALFVSLEISGCVPQR